MVQDYDILIIGGGMVGASLAWALRDVPLRIGVVEAASPVGELPPDDRSLALSLGSRRIFEALSLWDGIAAGGAAPIRRIHVSDRGHFGLTRLDAAEEGVDALGYVVSAGTLGGLLRERLSQLPGDLICPGRLHSLTLVGERAEVLVETGGRLKELSARLVVAADGDRSRARELLGAQTFRVWYDQTAIVANVETDRAHADEAFERFTDSGPLALLPLPSEPSTSHHRALVWTVRDRERDEVLGLSDEALLARLQERFGHRAGRFTAVGRRSAFPLGLQYVREPVRHRLVFIGNAAHTVHPIAGQGFNLGLRDVAALAEVLAEVRAGNGDPGALDNLQRYGQWRRYDYLRVLGLTDGLVRLFSSRFTPLIAARDLAMLGLDLFPAARAELARQTMGLTGRLPRLARGLPLWTGQERRQDAAN